MSLVARTRPRLDVVFHRPWVTQLLVPGSGPPPGGAETQIFLLTRALARRGMNVGIVAFDHPGLPQDVDGVRVVRRAPYPWKAPLRKLRIPAQIFRSLASVESEVVVQRGGGAEIPIVQGTCRILGRRYINATANLADFSFTALNGPGRDARLAEFGLRHADDIVVQTDEQAAACAEVLARDAVVIRSIAEPGDRPENGDGGFLWVGRIVWYKRPLAFLELASRCPDIPFTMVGVGTAGDPGHAELAEQVRSEAEGIPNLKLLPPTPRAELLRRMAGMTAIVNTADFEGLSNVCLEGWARGIPSIALTHDPDGLLEGGNLGGFAYGDKDRLTEMVRDVWSRRDAMDDVAEACIRHVADTHSEESVCRQWMKLFGKL